MVLPWRLAEVCPKLVWVLYHANVAPTVKAWEEVWPVNAYVVLYLPHPLRSSAV